MATPHKKLIAIPYVYNFYMALFIYILKINIPMSQSAFDKIITYYSMFHVLAST